jgi:hypothetical protein
MMVHYKKDKEERMQFFFCNNDIERCIEDTRRNWINSRSNVPNIWLMKIGANLTKKQILDLENASFQLPQHANMSPRRLFGIKKLLFDLFTYPTPTSLDDHPTTRSCKNIRKNKNTPTTKYANDYMSSLRLKVIFV